MLVTGGRIVGKVPNDEGLDLGPLPIDEGDEHPIGAELLPGWSRWRIRQALDQVSQGHGVLGQPHRPGGLRPAAHGGGTDLHAGEEGQQVRHLFERQGRPKPDHAFNEAGRERGLGG